MQRWLAARAVERAQRRENIINGNRTFEFGGLAHRRLVFDGMPIGHPGSQDGSLYFGLKRGMMHYIEWMQISCEWLRHRKILLSALPLVTHCGLLRSTYFVSRFQTVKTLIRPPESAHWQSQSASAKKFDLDLLKPFPAKLDREMPPADHPGEAL
ncbi:hypothetical protein K3180_04805 [Qipengyuania sp. YG19]|nr:hypothetical protein [Qipengyuania huizhouensis]